MKKWLLTLLYIVPLGVQAQRVQLVVSGTPVTIQPVQTQTEVRAGWRIVDIQLNLRMARRSWTMPSYAYARNGTAAGYRPHC